MREFSLFYYRRGQYFVSPFLVVVSMILFIISCINDDYFSVPFHSGAILVCLITIIASSLLYRLLLSSLFQDYGVPSSNITNFNLRSEYIEKVVFMLTFVFLTCLPLAVGVINLYESNRIKDKDVSYFVFQVYPQEKRRVRGGLLNCYKIINDEDDLTICSQRKTLENLKWAKIGIYKGLISTFYKVSKSKE